jgi:hypothetical protein
MAVEKTTIAIRREKATRLVNEALAARIGPDTLRTYLLPVGSTVRV